MTDHNKKPDLSFDAFLRSTGGGPYSTGGGPYSTEGGPEAKQARRMWEIDPLMSVEKHNTVAQLTHDYARMVAADADFRQIWTEAFKQWADQQVAMGREYATLTAGEFERDAHLLALVRCGLPEDTEEFVKMPYSSLLK